MENNVLHQGEILKKILKDKSISDMEISKRLGISRQSVMEIYKREKIKRGRLMEIAELFNIDISVFGLDETETEKVALLKELVESQREQIKLLREKIEHLENK